MPIKLKPPARIKWDTPSVEFGLTNCYHEDGHLKCGQSQDDLPEKRWHQLVESFYEYVCQGSHIPISCA